MNQDESILPIIIQQGTDFVLPVQFLDQNGNPVPLTGATAVFTVRSSVTSSVVVAQTSVGSGGITINSVQGIMTINIPASVTVNLPAPFIGVYNLLVTSPIGVISRALQGPATITAEVLA